MAGPARLRPLIVRPGARFACTGDGLCCTDVHLLGPVSAREGAVISTLRKDAIVRLASLRLLGTTDEGRCVFLDDGLRCGIYEHDGGRTKPRTCHRYPFILVATPDGGRVATDHRCPCRTMGERPLLTAEAAIDPLRNAAGRVIADRRMAARVPIAPRRHVGWARYRAIEDALLSAIVERSPEDALSATPFPELEDMSWPQIAADLAMDMPPTQWGWACRTFAVFLRARFGGPAADARFRPWERVFDRAERRATEEGDPEVMLRDFVADAIWSLEWAWRGTLLHARIELATRVAIVRDIAAHLASHGARADRAMAEAIAVAEIAGVSESWSTVVARMDVGEQG
jgi:Fe-S-cluster containining protein